MTSRTVPSDGIPNFTRTERNRVPDVHKAPLLIRGRMTKRLDYGTAFRLWAADLYFRLDESVRCVKHKVASSATVL